MLAGAPAFLLCDLMQSGVERQPVKTVDLTWPAARLSFAAAAVERLADSGNGAWKTLSNRAAVFLAFEQLGSAETALGMACAYAQERAAFGRKVGSFQAIKHKLADMYTKIQLARCHCHPMAPGRFPTDALEVPLARPPVRGAARSTRWTSGGAGRKTFRCTAVSA